MILLFAFCCSPIFLLLFANFLIRKKNNAS